MEDETTDEKLRDALQGLTDAVSLTLGPELRRAQKVLAAPPVLCIDCIELKNALASAVGVANEARKMLDRDNDTRALKILIALAGYAPKYRSDTDRIHDVLKRAVERLADVPAPTEKSP